MHKNYFNYVVYEDGKVYSNKSKKYLKGEITKHGYLQYTLSLNGKPTRIKSHRLVAELFLEKTNPEYNIVNHIDGNKLNNHCSNLEWCDYKHNNRHARETGLNNVSKSNSDRWNDTKFRKETSKKISEGRKKMGISKGSKNPRFRYLIKYKDVELNREKLSIMIDKSISYTDVLIRKSANGETVDIFKKLKIEIVDTKKS